MGDKPIVPKFSGREFYGPKPAGTPVADYDSIQRQPELPTAGLPSSTAAGQAAASIPAGGFDPDAPDILKLIQGSKFSPPFTVTLMRRTGVQVFKSDAGQKTEPKYEFVKETICEPSDLLRLVAGIRTEVYKPLNEMTLEFQFMLYLGFISRTMTIPGAPTVVSDKGKTVAGEST